MPPFSPQQCDFFDVPVPVSIGDSNSEFKIRMTSNDSSQNLQRQIPFKPLVLEMSSTTSPLTASATSTISTSTSSTSFNPLSSSDSSAKSILNSSLASSHQILSSPEAGAPSDGGGQQSKQSQTPTMIRRVLFQEDVDVVTVEHHPIDIHNRWYTKRELHIIRHKIRSLLRWYNKREEHYFQYEQQERVEYYDDDSQESYLSNIPPPPRPPCVSFYDECLFGLEKHLFRGKKQVRETKWNAQNVVLEEQQLQKQSGCYNRDRLAHSYAETSYASRQEALVIAQINAEESELHRQELEEQQRLEEEKRIRLQYLQQQKDAEQRRIESFETTILLRQKEDSDLEDLFLGEGLPPRNPLNIFKNLGECLGKLFHPPQIGEVDDDDDDDCYIFGANRHRQPNNDCL